MKIKYIAIIASCLFIIIAGLCYSCSYKNDEGQEILLTSKDSQEEDEGPCTVEVKTKDDNLESESGRHIKVIDVSEEPMIYVHLCGAVVNPNVYQVKKGTRLVELIDISGGLIPEAADDYINQAMVVEDGQRIYIPTKDELEQLGVTDYMTGDNNSPINDKESKKVNINSADETELMSLPGIGQAKAKSIVDYRKKNGDFRAVADIMNVSGIKEGLFTQIMDLVTVK